MALGIQAEPSPDPAPTSGERAVDTGAQTLDAPTLAARAGSPVMTIDAPTLRAPAPAVPISDALARTVSA